MNANVSRLLNEQINKEFYSAYLYLDFANYYKDAELNGFSNWYQVQAQEERDHAMLFIQYLQNSSRPHASARRSRVKNAIGRAGGWTFDGFPSSCFPAVFAVQLKGRVTVGKIVSMRAVRRIRFKSVGITLRMLRSLEPLMSQAATTSQSAI